jgi:hypothetical protein
MHTCGMGEHRVELDTDGAAEPGSERFKHLPARVRLEDTVATKDTRVPRDPEAGRDTDRDFMFRYMSS